jgi:hypothetical protein
MDRRLFAVRSYAKAILTFREYVEGLRDPAHGSQAHLRLQRCILELVTMCEESGWKYIGLVNNKGFDEYLYNHSVNVTVLSLILGLHLRLARPRLSELGMAAMLHHLGKARLPQEVMDKQGVLTEEERKIIASHSSLGIHELLRSRQYNESLLKRIMVMAEHHESHSEKSNTHPFSRIVAIAETFDALTTSRPYRTAHLPDIAIGMLSRLAGSRLDRELTLAFIQSVGVYPSGTVVELSDQSIGVVSHPGKDSKAWKSPHVRLIRSPSYQEILNGPVIDLSQPVEGKPAVEIVRTLEPGHLGINPAGYLFMEPPKRDRGF